MSDDAPRWASFSSAFSIVLSSANDRITELGCTPVGEDPHSFVDRGGLRRLETEAAAAAIKRVREAAYPLIFKLFGAEMPSGKERALVFEIGSVKTWPALRGPWDIVRNRSKTICTSGLPPKPKETTAPPPLTHDGVVAKSSCSRRAVAAQLIRCVAFRCAKS